MQDVELVLEVGQAADHRDGDAAGTALFEATDRLEHDVQRQPVHELHADGDVVGDGVRPVEAFVYSFFFCLQEWEEENEKNLDRIWKFLFKKLFFLFFNLVLRFVELINDFFIYY